jgi:hypothetical protein
LQLVQRLMMMRGHGAEDLPAAHPQLVIAAVEAGAREHEYPHHSGQHEREDNRADAVRHILVVHTFIPRRNVTLLPQLSASGPREGTPEEAGTVGAGDHADRGVASARCQ